MIAVQGEQVTRIDADTEEIAMNVSGAQTFVFLSFFGLGGRLMSFDFGEKQRAVEVLRVDFK